MAEQDWLEVPVFIHGITSEREPASHASSYFAFLRLVNEALAARGKKAIDAYKVEVEVDGGRAVVDRCVDLREKFPAVHSAYWRSSEIADCVGETF